MRKRHLKGLAGYPHLMKEWHPTRNEGVDPFQIPAGTHRKVWWLCEKAHEWEARVNSRTHGSGCPYCAGKKIGPEMSLGHLFPGLIQEWNTLKNGDKTPYDVSPGSHHKFWWRCEKGHEWQAAIRDRTRSGYGCPYCRKLSRVKHPKLRAMPKGSLAHNFPHLVDEWLQKGNGGLTPDAITCGSGRRVWWQCPKGHKWRAEVKSRTKGSGCPYCAGNKASPKYNFGLRFPDLAKEWHPTKNQNLAPSDFTPKSAKKVWWLCEKGHSWKAPIHSRAKGTGCPCCSNQKVYEENCLAVIRPDFAKEWHPTKNGKLTPYDVTPGSNKKVWWQGTCGHAWRTKIQNRTLRDQGCPVCAGKFVTSENSLAVTYPDIALQWHPAKNGSRTPHDVTAGSGYRAWWRCDRGHEWKTEVKARVRGTGCPYCSNQTSRIEIRIYCELKAVFGPDKVRWRHRINDVQCDISLPSYAVAVEYDGRHWHESAEDKDRNKESMLGSAGILLFRVREHGLNPLSERDVTLEFREKEVSMVCKLFDKLATYCQLAAEDQLRMYSYIQENRLRNVGEYQEIIRCLPSPPLEESLTFQHSRLVAEWDFEKNAPLTPEMFSPGSNEKVYWRCMSGHLWRATICKRVSGRSCPYCAGTKASPENNLAVKFPDLTNEWHPTKNGQLSPHDVTPGSSRKVWWTADCGHQWAAPVGCRTVQKQGCPYCAGKRVGPDNNFAAKYPELALQWHPTKNGSLKPEEVTSGSKRKVWWKCNNGPDHEWVAAVGDRGQGQRCPFCSGHRPSQGYNLAVKNPRIASEWHPIHNGSLQPSDVTPGSEKKVWWACANGHEWKAVVKNRTKGAGCPECYKQRRLQRKG